MVAYVDEDDLKARFTPAQVKRAFCDDGTQTLDVALFAVGVAAVSAKADAILAKAWPDAAARVLLVGDEGIKDSICVMLMHWGARRRPEWVDANGKSPWKDAAKEAEATLELIAEAKLRPATEVTAGTNPTARGAINAPGGDFLFVSSNGKPTVGGY